MSEQWIIVPLDDRGLPLTTVGPFSSEAAAREWSNERRHPLSRGDCLFLRLWSPDDAVNRWVSAWPSESGRKEPTP